MQIKRIYQNILRSALAPAILAAVVLPFGLPFSGQSSAYAGQPETLAQPAQPGNQSINATPEMEKRIDSTVDSITRFLEPLGVHKIGSWQQLAAVLQVLAVLMILSLITKAWELIAEKTVQLLFKRKFIGILVITSGIFAYCLHDPFGVREEHFQQVAAAGPAPNQSR